MSVGQTAVAATAPATADRASRRATVTLTVGAGLLAAILLMLILAPVLAGHDPLDQDLQHVLQPPGNGHLLGTDELGRDVWARLLYGCRIDLLIAVSAVIAPFVIGSLLGLVTGYRRGIVDAVIMRILDIVVAFPFYVLIIAIVFALGPGVRSTFIAITVVGWIAYARIVRAEVLVAAHAGYVQAARGAGYSGGRILLRHIAPNVMAQAIVYAKSDVVLTMLAVATLGYLGLGIQLPTPELGTMMQEGRPVLSLHPLLATAPGVLLVLIGLSLSLIGDGLTAVLGRRR